MKKEKEKKKKKKHESFKKNWIKICIIGKSTNSIDIFHATFVLQMR